MASAAAAQPATKYGVGSMTTAGGGPVGTGSLTPLFFPRQKCGNGQAERDRNEGGTQFEQEPDGQDGCPQKELPFHFHIITTNINTSMAEKTIAGTVSGFVHSTLRILVCCRVRISFICWRASAS